MSNPQHFAYLRAIKPLYQHTNVYSETDGFNEAGKDELGNKRKHQKSTESLLTRLAALDSTPLARKIDENEDEERIHQETDGRTDE
ncbi:hypothetical protein Pmani_012207 [Petrolisthes manimaculis]|uniref:Uncharacterized protein n=1 Tax=Petrolisthes manimaculis TaxID=1843537 RepID=A0AAE1UAP9_9EUCA|nr:hypothetical protein Pmani_012207 [Petrolisthes manimaculis]